MSTAELSEWDYPLPASAIAKYPASKRDHAKLMRVVLGSGELRHGSFAQVGEYLRPGDLLVANNTRVMAARLWARRTTGGRVELVVLGTGPGPVPVLAKPARKLRHGEVLHVEGGALATVVREAEALRVRFDAPVHEVLQHCGHVPIPPYLGRDDEAVDRDRYQTVYAGPLGSVAAPTAGLHFTNALIAALGEQGMSFVTVTLHVGLGTFLPLRKQALKTGVLHQESYVVPHQTAQRIADTRAAGGRVIAVGTTTVRTLESATPIGATAPVPGPGDTQLFIRPGYAFRAIDGMITNFHLPKSSLLMLVAALVGRERLLAAYATALSTGYRFYSYGDAMLVL